MVKPMGTVTNGTYITNTTAPLRIGAIAGMALRFDWNGDIAETVVYNRVLAANERSHVRVTWRLNTVLRSIKR